MYEITAPTQYNGVGYGIRFVDGVGKTDNAHTAWVLQNKGYAVREIPDGDPFDGLSPIPSFDPDKAKGDELKEFARENDIDLGDASKVEDIRAVVKAWISANADNGEDDGSPKVLTPPPSSGVMMGGGASVQVSGGSGQR